MSSAVRLTVEELLRARHYAAAAAACATALESEGEGEETVALRILRARALLALGQDDPARVELAQCLSLAPSALIYRMLGAISLRRRQLDTASCCLRRALALDPTDLEAARLLQIASSLTEAMPPRPLGLGTEPGDASITPTRK